MLYINSFCIMCVCICSWWWDVHTYIYIVSSVVFVDFLIKSSFQKIYIVYPTASSAAESTPEQTSPSTHGTTTADSGKLSMQMILLSMAISLETK